MKQFRPMLAATVEDLNTLDMRSPLLVSPKIDGVRGIFMNGQILSRSLKPLPNKQLQDTASAVFKINGDAMEGIECELVIGSPSASNCYRKTSSTLMSHDAKIEGLNFLAFDRVGEGCYRERLKSLSDVSALIDLIPQYLIKERAEILHLHDYYAERGYEGLILRCPNAPYKFGRSTLKERGLLKYKKFTDDEAVVIGFEELMTNNNTQEKNELGYSKRSSKKANLAGANTLGALIVEYNGLEFKIGTGFTQADRDHIWANRCAYLGLLVKFKYFAVGVKDLPRHPVWLGFRNEMDMS